MSAKCVFKFVVDGSDGVYCPRRRRRDRNYALTRPTDADARPKWSEGGKAEERGMTITNHDLDPRKEGEKEGTIKWMV